MYRQRPPNRSSNSRTDGDPLSPSNHSRRSVFIEATLSRSGSTGQPSEQAAGRVLSPPPPASKVTEGATAAAAGTPAFPVRGVRVRPPILLPETLYVDQRRGQVRLVPHLPHVRSASPGLQRDRRRGNDGDLRRVGVGGGGGVLERHRCGLRRRAGKMKGGLREGVLRGLDDKLGGRGVARS